MGDKRLSELVDMMIIHLLYGRTAKALKIGQYLRNRFGFYTVPNLDCATGHKVRNVE